MKCQTLPVRRDSVLRVLGALMKVYVVEPQSAVSKDTRGSHCSTLKAFLARIILAKCSVGQHRCIEIHCAILGANVLLVRPAA